MHKLEDVFDCQGPVDFVAVGTFNETAQETTYVPSSYLSAPLTAETTVQEGPPSPRTLSGLRHSECEWCWVHVRLVGALSKLKHTSA